jgi:hypothetical protein
MLTREQVQNAIELLKRKRQAYTHRPIVSVRENPVPEGETRLMLQTENYDDWKPIFDAHPELRDALTLVVMASLPSDRTQMPIAPLIRRSISEWVDFYESLPPDVLDTDPPLGLHALIRNLANRIFYAMPDDDDTVIDTDDEKRLLSLSVSRPPVVQAAGLNARVLHDMLFKALVYPLLPESERDAMLEQVADAVEQFIDAYGTGAFPEINGQIFTRIAYPIEFLPIAHVFSRALDDPTASGITRRYFTDVLGEDRYHPTSLEQSWVYEKFAPLFDEGLRDLFARREFSHDSVRAVLREGFGRITEPSALNQILKEIWKRGFPMTFYGLVAVFSREFPEQSMRIARLVARAVPNAYAATMYLHLAQGLARDRNSEPVEFVSQPMRDAAKMALPIVYQRVFRGKQSRSPRLHEQRGEFARVTASAVLGIETDNMKHYYQPEVWIDLWEGFHDMLTNPSEMLKDPEKMAAYRKARDRIFWDGIEDEFCK